MVWQDFAMACALYPQDDAFAEKLRREATSVVREYRHHPSIILWSGDNEVDQIMYSMKLAPSENRLTREVLADVVRRNDRGRPYLESSPYMDDSLLTETGLYPPEDHPWGPRDYYKSSFYAEGKAHFISETGYHGCPSLSSIRRFITEERVWPYKNNSEWRTHSTDWYGDYDRVTLMEKQVKQLFGNVPKDPEDYILASQISQAEADKYFIERARAARPRISGIIWWNLLDGWPQMSDAVVDYYFEKKLAYRYIRRSQAPFTMMFDELKNWNLRLLAANDTQGEVRGQVKVIDADTGEKLVDQEFCASPNQNTDICRLPIFYSEQRLLLIVWQLEDGSTGQNHYLTGFPAFSLEKYRGWIEAGWL
jgi:beta-mannosidase